MEQMKRVIELFQTSQRIVVLCGAGISVAAGIPDFRSRHGLYAQIAEKYPELETPQQMFDIDFFHHNPAVFYHFASQILPEHFQPTLTHYFIAQLERRNQLLRDYTQNIDTLELYAGITKVVYCHGSFAQAHCSKCKLPFPSQQLRKSLSAQQLLYCPSCPAGGGLIKPGIVFFGEPLPLDFYQAIAQDRKLVDLFVVIGSSLKVDPVGDALSFIPEGVPTVLINMEKVGQPKKFDYYLLGDCQEICGMLSQALRGVTMDGILEKVREESPGTFVFPSRTSVGKCMSWTKYAEHFHGMDKEGGNRNDNALIQMLDKDRRRIVKVHKHVGDQYYVEWDVSPRFGWEASALVGMYGSLALAEFNGNHGGGVRGERVFDKVLLVQIGDRTKDLQAYERVCRNSRGLLNNSLQGNREQEEEQVSLYDDTTVSENSDDEDSAALRSANRKRNESPRTTGMQSSLSPYRTTSRNESLSPYTMTSRKESSSPTRTTSNKESEFRTRTTSNKESAFPTRMTISKEIPLTRTISNKESASPTPTNSNKESLSTRANSNKESSSPTRTTGNKESSSTNMTGNKESSSNRENFFPTRTANNKKSSSPTRTTNNKSSSPSRTSSNKKSASVYMKASSSKTPISVEDTFSPRIVAPRASNRRTSLMNVATQPEDLVSSSSDEEEEEEESTKVEGDDASPAEEPPKVQEESTAEYYFVESVLDRRVIHSKGKSWVQYLVKWEGFSHDENTWEPEEHLSGCKEALEQFEKRRRRRLSKSSSGNSSRSASKSTLKRRKRN